MGSWLLAFRQLLRKPLFTVSLVLLLALGISANTTLFSLVSAIFLKPLPYPEADQLVWVMEANNSKSQPESLVAPTRLEDWKRLNHSFSAMAGFYSDSQTDTSGLLPERLLVVGVTPGYFDVYSVNPVVGRTFNRQEQVFNGPQAIVLSYALWSRRFNKSGHVLGKRLVLNGTGYTVVGVMPPGFIAPSIDAWLSAPMNPYLANARDARFLSAVGRLKRGRGIAEGQSDLELIQKNLGREYPLTDAGWSARVTGLKSEIIGDHGQFLWLTFGAVGLLLALACANIAGLLLGHVAERQREFALRASLGASQWQIASTLLKELTILASTGLALGVLLSYWGVAAAVKLFAQMPRIHEAELNWQSVLFACAISSLILLAIGWVPAWQATRAQLSFVLAQGGRTQANSRHTFQRFLLVAQFALTLVLLATAGLLLRSYQRLATLDAGFDPKHVLTFHIGAGWAEDRGMIGQMQNRVLAALVNRPDVEAAGATNFLPGEDASLRYQYEVEGLTGGTGEHKYTAGYRTVSGGYFKAMHIPVLAGEACPGVLMSMNEPAEGVVNDAFVQSFAPGQNLLGHSFHVVGTDIHYSNRIRGVVGNVRDDNLRMAPAPYAYSCASAGGWPDMTYVVRTRSDAGSFAQSVQTTVHQIAPHRAVFALDTMETHVDAALAQPRLTAGMLVGFAVAAVMLAAFGLYSLFALLVATRTREIGTRMALGAQTSQVILHVLGGASRLLGLGILCGTGLALATAVSIRSLLFGISATDPVTFGAVIVLLSLVCLAATLIPALRAASISPLEAIRME